VPGLLELGAMTARPYRLPLLSNASPGAVIAQLREGDRPGALWGTGSTVGVDLSSVADRGLFTRRWFGYLDEQPN
jgi:hypothetical protein